MLSSKSKFWRETVPPDCFANNGAHLRAEIGWLHQVIRREIQVAQTEGAPGFDEFAGLYISQEEVGRYLEQREGDEDLEDPVIQRLRGEVTGARRVLDRRVEISLAAGIDLRLGLLARRFELDAVARATVLCCAAAELNTQVSRLFAYLQNDAGKKRPTFALLARLSAMPAVDPVGLRTLFGPSSPLFVHRLLDTGVERADIPFPALEARLATGVVDFLVGIDRLPPLLAEVAVLMHATNALEDLAYHRRHRAIVEELLRCRRAEGKLPFSYVGGPDGAGKLLIGESVAAELRKSLLRIDATKLPAVLGNTEEFGHALAREARLRDCLIVLQAADEAIGDCDSDKAKSGAFEPLLHALAGCEVVATGTTPPAELRHRLRTRPLSFEVAYPTLGERIEIWERRLPADAAAGLGADLPALGGKFRFTPGQIDRVIGVAEMAAVRGADGRPHITSADLHLRCRDEAEQGLHLFCQKIVPRYNWGDIALSADTHAQLQEICRWVAHRSQVYEAWGYGAKLALGRGVTVLFSGASGTGKTMSAEVIAADLQLDLFRVDLSRIVSKYIGETEKNLSRIFAHSSNGNCVLFFDEADALFGKRTEVKDAHDRYANIEINYLLAEMDRYEGVIIVSTNMKGNFDQAFIRRFSHVVEYPIPNERLREVIWRKSVPSETPLGSEVNFSFLAERFDLSGGNIRNIALNSAFLAAADGRGITMDHVILATKREYQKIGRVCSKSDFGQHYALVREAEVR